MRRQGSQVSMRVARVNLQNGILFVNSRIDREELCGRSVECSIHLEVIVDRPLQVFHVEVEVKDINDLAQLRGSRDSCAQRGEWLQLSAFSPGSPRRQGVICQRLGQLGFYSLTQGAGGRHAAQSQARPRPPGTVQPRALVPGRPGTLQAGGDPGRGENRI